MLLSLPSYKRHIYSPFRLRAYPSSPVLIKIYKGPKIGKYIFSSNLVVTRTMITSIKRGTQAMLLTQETFLKYCDHFQYIPYNELHKDSLVLEHLAKIIKEKDTLCNRAFQLALEATYTKRCFNRSEALLYFDNAFSVNNIFDSNDLVSGLDQSTIFTALQVSLIKEIYPKWEFVVNKTPTFNIPKDLEPKLKELLELNKTLTTNTCPDISINGISHDLKATKNATNTKNQVYVMVESSEAFAKFERHINQLTRIIKTQINNPFVFSTEFESSMQNRLNKTISEWKIAKDSKTKKEIIESWNCFSIEIAPQRPSNFGTPIFFFTKKSYEPDPHSLEKMAKINIPEGHLDYVKSKQIVLNILRDYSPEIRDNVFHATYGFLNPSILSDNDNNFDS